MIRYKCPNCTAFLESPEELAGKSDTCPACQAKVPVPIPTKSKVSLPLVLAGAVILSGAIGVALLLVTTRTPKLPEGTAEGLKEEVNALKADVNALKEELKTLGTRKDAQTAQKEIRAKGFIVEDEKGNPRAMLTVGKRGPELRLNDENGKTVAVLIGGEREPMLSLWGKNGTSAELSLLSAFSMDMAHLKLSGKNGDTAELRVVDGPLGGNVGRSLRLCDKHGNPIAELSSGQGEREPMLSLWGKNGASAELSLLNAFGMDMAHLKLSGKNGDTAELSVVDGPLGGNGPSLTLCDKNTNPIATLIGEQGGGRVCLYDEKNKLRARLNGGSEAPGLWVSDENGKSRARVSVSKDGASLNLYDDKGKPSAGLSALKRGPTLMLNDENGKAGATVLVSKDGTSLNLYDENDKVRASVGVSKDGASLDLFDENDKVRASVGVSKDGPSMNLFDEKGKQRAGLGAARTKTPDGKIITHPESSLLLFGPDGKVVWSAPQ